MIGVRWRVASRVASRLPEKNERIAAGSAVVIAAAASRIALPARGVGWIRERIGCARTRRGLTADTLAGDPGALRLRKATNVVVDPPESLARLARQLTNHVATAGLGATRATSSSTSLALAAGRFEKRAVVLRSQMRREQPRRGQVELPAFHEIEDDGELAHDPRHAGTVVGRVLGEVQHPPTVDEKRRVAFAEMQAAFLERDEVSQKVRGHLAAAMCLLLQGGAEL